MGGVAIVVFCDLVDSTALLARLGDDRMDALRRAHVADVHVAVGDTGGRVIKTLGDGAMASFESALGALRAAAAIQASTARLDRAHGSIGLAARVGIAAGEPIADGEDLHGMAVVVASRLCAAASSGEVLVQQLVCELVASRDAVALDGARAYELKGIPQPVRAAVLHWDKPPTSGDDDTGAPSPQPATARRPIPLPRVLAAYASEPLIGRDREIAALRDATSARPGCRAALLIGEPGIGKTRHAAAAAADAHARGAVVVLARCPPEPAIAFEPWVRAIGELALGGDDAWRARLARAGGDELSALVPELGDVGPRAGRGAGGDELALAEGARYRLLRGISATLACAADGAPLHVVLDDAHWCDPASAQALRHLLESAPVDELTLVVTARAGELPRGHPVARVLADLRRTRDLHELRLDGLDPDGLARLVSERVGRAITPRVAARLQTRTGGNPFFAAELVRDLDERGALNDEQALHAMPVPDAVSDLVEERLGRLDAPTERLLTAVAAIGPSAPVALAARAAGLDEAAAAAAVQAALSERLVNEVPATHPTIAFPHALVREALAARTGDAGRAHLHLAIARVLEQNPDTEPSELARHCDLAVPMTGPAPALAAHKAAAAAAAARHDHEQAAAHLRSALALVPADDAPVRAGLQLELGEQQLLAADLQRARHAFRAACDAARASDDPVTFAQAALGFAGGDVGFGWEAGLDDPLSVALLREGLAQLGEREPRLALRMIFRLVYLQTLEPEVPDLPALVRRARALGEQLGDPEAQLLAYLTELLGLFIRSPDPYAVFPAFVAAAPRLLDLAQRCGRDDLLFRSVMLHALVRYLGCDVPGCEAALDAAEAIAERMGSPRFAWEIDAARGQRLLDRGARAESEARLRAAGDKVRRLRPDIQIVFELLMRAVLEWIYDADATLLSLVARAVDELTPRPLTTTLAMLADAAEGDHDSARGRLTKVLAGGMEALRQPDGHMPAVVSELAFVASEIGERSAVTYLRPLLDPLRPYVATASPGLAGPPIPQWTIGRLELLDERPTEAVRELRAAVAQLDAIEIVWQSAWARTDLALALHRSGERDAARATLAEADTLAERHGIGAVQRAVAVVRAELEGREPPPHPRPATEHRRVLRDVTARTGRRTLGAMLRGLDDVALEQRFSEARRQRALLRAMAHAFQPALAGRLHAVVAYELEPQAIDPPADAPWRWAMELDGPSGHARLLEPAPLDATTTIHISLADWVRTVAGLQSALETMVSGRCSVEGEVAVAARLETVFGAR